MSAAARAARRRTVRRLAAAIRGAQLYAPGHPLVTRSVTALVETLAIAHQSTPSVAIGIVGDDLVVGEIPVPRAAETMGELMRRAAAGRHRAHRHRPRRQRRRDRAARRPSSPEAKGDQTRGALAAAAHPRRAPAGEERLDASGRHRDVPAPLRRCGVGGGTSLGERQREGKPDADAARGMVDSLAQAVAQNRTALLALTALKNYDNYTFTHMVNVSILTMGQARGLGIDGALLREFGLAALMHDIGKVQTPNEILNKPDKLDRRGVRRS